MTFADRALRTQYVQQLGGVNIATQVESFMEIPKRNLDETFASPRIEAAYQAWKAKQQ